MNLRIIRKQLGLSQKEVAEHLECSPTVYSRYETGERQPSIDVLIKMSAFFGVSIDVLIGNAPHSDAKLTTVEHDLLVAFHNADDRAKQDAMTLLKNHTVFSTKK